MNKKQLNKIQSKQKSKNPLIALMKNNKKKEITAPNRFEQIEDDSLQNTKDKQISFQDSIFRRSSLKSASILIQIQAMKACHYIGNRIKKLSQNCIRIQEKQKHLRQIIQIYTSERPGLGKTYEIMKKIKKQNKLPIVFTISGKVINQHLITRFKNEIKNKNKYILIILLKQISQKSIDVVNQFIQKLIISIIQKNNIQFICQASKLFIQIQNQSILNKLQVLQQIIEQYPQVLTKIQHFSIQNIQYKIDNLKLGYVLEYLQSYNNQKLDCTCLPSFRKYQPTNLVKNHVFLLEKYFLKPFKQQSSKLTYNQFHSWLDSIYKLCCSFQNSPCFSINKVMEANPDQKIQSESIKIRSKRFKFLLDYSIGKKQSSRFASSNEEQVRKYISSLLKQIDNQLPNFNVSQLICLIHKKLSSFQWSSVSLSDVERFKRIYMWLKNNLPHKSVINFEDNSIISKTMMQKYQKNKILRAFIISLNITYFNRLDTKQKQDEIIEIINNNSINTKIKDINYEIMREYKKFEVNDFSKRIKINQKYISMNQILKQNLYFIFICTMNYIPAIIIGNSGYSKSLSYKIFIDNFKNHNNQQDIWIQKFPRVTQFFIQGSQFCKIEDIQQKFILAQKYANCKMKSKKKIEKNIPLIIIDDISIMKHSFDHLFDTSDEKNANVSFLGLGHCNSCQQTSSKFLVLKICKPSIYELKKTCEQISKNTLTNCSYDDIKMKLDCLCDTYQQFISQQREENMKNEEIFQNFFGLKDFYSLVIPLINQISHQFNKNSLKQNINKLCDQAIYRSFNGLQNSYELFKEKYFQQLRNDPPNQQRDAFQSIKKSIPVGYRPLLVVTSDNGTQSYMIQSIKNSMQQIEIIDGNALKNEKQCFTSFRQQIIKSIQSGKRIIISNINKQLEGILFDLLNRNFLKIGRDRLRIAIQNNLGIELNIKNNCNIIIIINKNNIHLYSSNFINKFQKYYCQVDEEKLFACNIAISKIKIPKIIEKNIQKQLGFFLQYSQIEIDILFRKQIKQKMKKIIKQKDNFDQNFQQFQKQYNNQLKKYFSKPQLFTQYKCLRNEYFFDNLMKRFCQQKEIPNDQAKNFVFPRQIQNYINRCENQQKQSQTAFLKKMVLFFGISKLWILNYRLQQIFKIKGVKFNIEVSKNIKIMQFTQSFTSQLFNKLALKNGQFMKKKEDINTFITLHNRILHQISKHLSNQQQNRIEYMNIKINDEFLNLWKNQQHKLFFEMNKAIETFQKIKEQNICKKIKTIIQFLKPINEKQLIKMSFQKIFFPNWYHCCEISNQQTGQVFETFQKLYKCNLIIEQNKQPDYMVQFEKNGNGKNKNGKNQKEKQKKQYEKSKQNIINKQINNNNKIYQIIDEECYYSQLQLPKTCQNQNQNDIFDELIEIENFD